MLPQKFAALDRHLVCLAVKPGLSMINLSLATWLMYLIVSINGCYNQLVQSSGMHLTRAYLGSNFWNNWTIFFLFKLESNCSGSACDWSFGNGTLYIFCFITQHLVLITDPRFRIASPTSAAVTASSTGAPKFSPSLYTGRQSYCYPSSAGQQTSVSPEGRSWSLPRISFDEQTGGFCPVEVVTFNLSPLNLECSNSSMSSSVSPNFSSHHSSASYMSNLLNSSILSDGSAGLSQNLPMNSVSAFACDLLINSFVIHLLHYYIIF